MTMLQPKSKFPTLLNRPQPLLLDGGLATQLEAQGCDIGNELWSASLLESNPEAIVTAHRAYLSAGAECIATASYQASREGYKKQGFTLDDADSLMRTSVQLAKRACDEERSDAAVAASLGPFGAMRHDGSEYSGDYGVTSKRLRDFHESRLKIFDDNPDVDVLALETIPSVQEAEVLAELLKACQTPSWISFSCRDELNISDGTPLAEAASLFADHPGVIAVGINCTPPQFAPALIRELTQALPDKSIMAYPNSGEIYNVEDNSWSGTVTPGDCASAAREWIAAGAKIVGGCCRMGPQHMRAIAGMISETRWQ